MLNVARVLTFKISHSDVSEISIHSSDGSLPDEEEEEEARGKSQRKVKRQRRRLVQANSESPGDGREINEDQTEAAGKGAAKSGQQERDKKRRRIIPSEQESSDCGCTPPSSTTMRSPQTRGQSALAAALAETGVDAEKDPQLAAAIAVSLPTDLNVTALNVAVVTPY